VTDYADNPGYADLRSEFLRDVRAFHASFDYSRDWHELCRVLGIEVVEKDRNLYSNHGGRPTILLDRTEPPTRRAFTFPHELSHYLFRETDEAFHAVLEELYPGRSNTELRIEIEEGLCREAAALLLFPDHELATVLQEHGLDPVAVFALTRTRGSLWAGLVRVLSSFESDSWGVVMAEKGYAEFTWSTAKYSLGSDMWIEPQHPMHLAWSEHVECKAPLPFKGGKRTWKVNMRAAADGRRVVALFAREFPPRPDGLQETLFGAGEHEKASAI
jgi:hypothetical protein